MPNQIQSRILPTFPASPVFNHKQEPSPIITGSLGCLALLVMKILGIIRTLNFESIILNPTSAFTIITGLLAYVFFDPSRLHLSQVLVQSLK